MVASECHASLVGFGASSKAPLILWRARRAPPPRELAEIHAHFLADEMPLLGKQFLLHHAEHLGEKLNLLAGCRTPQGFDVGKNFACHVDATDQMQFCDEVAL